MERGHRTHDFETVLGKHPVESQAFYWAFRCDTFGTESDILAGFVRKDEPINFNVPLFECRSFIGVLPGRGDRFNSSNRSITPVMEPCSHGQEIGLLFKPARDDKKKGSILLFVEGRFQDYLEDQTIAPGLYYPAISL